MKYGLCFYIDHLKTTVKRKVMKVRYDKNIPLLPVEKPHAGGRYHVSWAKNGCVWVCISVDEEKKTVTLRTPKTKKVLENIKMSDLRHTRSAQYKIEKDVQTT